MTLIFETPSKRCPNRVMNGRPVVIENTGPRIYLRRAKRYVRVFFVTPAESRPLSQGWIAFEDELHVDPEVSNSQISRSTNGKVLRSDRF